MLGQAGVRRISKGILKGSESIPILNVTVEAA
jgi:hypothetical protein